MVFLQASPPSPLNNYIHQYWYVQTEDASELGRLKQMMFPIDLGALSFYLSDHIPVVEHYKNNIKRQVPVIFTGLITSPGSISFEPGVPLEGFVVAFWPHGFSDLFHIDVSTTTDLLPDFYSLFEDEGRKLYAQLQSSASFEEKLVVANSFFTGRLPAIDNSKQIIKAVNKIIESNGLIDVKKLADDVNMSSKTLERHFKSRIGVSPKMYARFKRFHYALSLLNDPSPKSWLEIAHECGYYDQAHFIKEFRQFTNQNPSAFSVIDYPLFYRFIIEK